MPEEETSSSNEPCVEEMGGQIVRFVDDEFQVLVYIDNQDPVWVVPMVKRTTFSEDGTGTVKLTEK